MIPVTVFLVMLMSGRAAAFDETSDPPEELDTDGDGIPDHVEVATGTSPFDVDTDGDGVPDGVEDANQDGVIDPGETDPRKPGLFPGAAPHIPEPMNFDLVRGLGASRGELEVNSLFYVSRPAGEHLRLDWAPEVEWAIVDGFAVEAELPMTDRTVVAYKGAVQWTAPKISEGVVHGLQGIAEYIIDERVTELSGLYLLGGRVRRTSLFAMVGPRFDVGAHRGVVGLFNPSVFVDVNEALTLGLENNVVIGKPEEQAALSLAQVHWQVSKVFRIQIGGGVDLRRSGVWPVGVARLILE
jgi:hypothetical protein